MTSLAEGRIKLEVFRGRAPFNWIWDVVSLEVLQVEIVRLGTHSKVVDVRSVLHMEVGVVICGMENSRWILLVVVEHVFLVRIRIELLLRKVRVVYTVQHLQFPVAAYSETAGGLSNYGTGSLEEFTRIRKPYSLRLELVLDD